MIERIPITDDEQWLALRRDLITASDISVVCGEGGFASAAVLFAEKKSLRPPKTQTDAMQRGRWGEPSVFEALADLYPQWQFTRAKIFLRDLENRIGATPDGFAITPDDPDKIVVQAKVISRSIFRDNWLLDPADSIDHGEVRIPPEYNLQTRTEMMLAQTRRGVLAVLITGEYKWHFRLFELERDDLVEARIQARVREFFINYLDPNIMPPLDFERDAELVRAIYPQDDGTEIDLTGDNRALMLVEELIETQAGRKRLETQEDIIKTELQAKLAHHTFARLADGRRLSWKLQHRKAYTAPAADFRVLRILKAASNKDTAA